MIEHCNHVSLSYQHYDFCCYRDRDPCPCFCANTRRKTRRLLKRCGMQAWVGKALVRFLYAALTIAELFLQKNPYKLHSLTMKHHRNAHFDAGSRRRPPGSGHARSSAPSAALGALCGLPKTGKILLGNNRKKDLSGGLYLPLRMCSSEGFKEGQSKKRPRHGECP